MAPLDETPIEKRPEASDRFGWLLALGLTALAVLGVSLEIRKGEEREFRQGGGVVAGSTASTPTQDVSRSPNPVGTAGLHEDAIERTDADVVRELETITGVNDPMSLVGRRVDLHVPVQDVANQTAFWVGPKDNRVLVVLERDDRGGEERQRGLPPTHHIVPVRHGQRAVIVGVVRPVPRVEDRYSWDLTRPEDLELQERRIYIRAESVTPEGHGTF